MEVVLRFEEQDDVMDSMSETVVALSAMTWSVVFCVADWKGAWKRGPPGREELFASPYCWWERMKTKDAGR